MSNFEFSDVQLINLSTLNTIRDGIQRDRVQTCCRFGLHAEQANFLEKLTSMQLLRIVVNVGNETLFPPRSDLTSIMQLPLPLTGVLSAARPLHRLSSEHLAAKKRS